MDAPLFNEYSLLCRLDFDACRRNVLADRDLGDVLVDLKFGVSDGKPEVEISLLDPEVTDPAAHEKLADPVAEQIVDVFCPKLDGINAVFRVRRDGAFPLIALDVVKNDFNSVSGSPNVGYLSLVDHETETLIVYVLPASPL